MVVAWLIWWNELTLVFFCSSFWSLDFSQILCYIKEKRQQLLNEIRTLCEACCYQGLVEFHGAFYTPGSGQISIALEYMDGGSLADILRVQKSIPEPVLSHMIGNLLKVSVCTFMLFPVFLLNKLIWNPEVYPILYWPSDVLNISRA